MQRKRETDATGQDPESEGLERRWDQAGGRVQETQEQGRKVRKNLILN